MAEASPSDSADPAACAINLEAHYDTPLFSDTPSHSLIEALVIDLKRSAVRIRNGWWASLKPRCGGVEEVKVLHGQTQVSMACVLDLGCNHDRRYRFLVCTRHHAESQVQCGHGNSNWVYYPTAYFGNYTRSTTIKLGDLGEEFPQFQMPTPKNAPGKTSTLEKKK